MEKRFLDTKTGKVLATLLGVVAIIALGSYALLNFERMDFLNPTPAVISVNGEGEVLAVPDVGKFTFSVNAEGKDAATAQEASGTKINAILAYLTEQGIAEKDVQTQNYNLYPKWRYEERVCASNSYCPPGERVADGFEVSQSVTVKVRETKEAGKIIAGVGDKGATNISNLSFTIDDVDVLKDQARAKAIANAQAEAEVLADQLGVELVRMVGFYESGGDDHYPMMESRAMMLEEASDGGFGGAELPMGEDATKAMVTITYEIR